MQNPLKNLLWLNKEVVFYVPSISIDEFKEMGKVVSVSDTGPQVRSHVDGYVHDLLFEDIVKFKNKGLNSIWQTKRAFQPSKLSKIFKRK